MKEQAERRLELKEKIEEVLSRKHFSNQHPEQILMLVDEYTNEIRGLTKGKSLEERRHDFLRKIFTKENTDANPLQMLNEFLDYWTEHNEGGKKMRFEMSKNFNIKDELKKFSLNK